MAELDDRLIRYVKRMARRYRVPGVDGDDLAQAAFLELARVGVPGDLSHAMQIAKRAMSHCLRRETRAGRNFRLSRALQLLDDLPERPADRAYPEPLPGTVALMQGLTDIECRVVTLVCGLDGATGRTYGEAGWILGKARQTVWRWYRSALEKLAAR